MAKPQNTKGSKAEKTPTVFTAKLENKPRRERMGKKAGKYRLHFRIALLETTVSGIPAGTILAVALDSVDGKAWTVASFDFEKPGWIAPKGSRAKLIDATEAQLLGWANGGTGGSLLKPHLEA